MTRRKRVIKFDLVKLIGVEYAYGHPQRYDGISEWLCPDCGYREGRWSGKALAEGESELRFGGR